MSEGSFWQKLREQDQEINTQADPVFLMALRKQRRLMCEVGMEDALGLIRALPGWGLLSPAVRQLIADWYSRCEMMVSVEDLISPHHEEQQDAVYQLHQLFYKVYHAPWWHKFVPSGVLNYFDPV